MPEGRNTSESYRRCCTSVGWVAQALALHLLKAEKAWAHDAFFDYVDRWMTEDDKERRQEIAKYWKNIRLDDDAHWMHQGYAWEPFVKTMWDKYRNHLPEASGLRPQAK